MFCSESIFSPTSLHTRSIWKDEFGRGTHRWLVGALVVAILGMPTAAHAHHFGFRAAGIGGDAPGIVTSHGVDLFEIRSAAGGLQPLQRAAVIAGRLEVLHEHEDLAPDSLSIRRSGQDLFLAEKNSIENNPQVLVTIDRALVNKIMGARHDPQRLAAWWLALLQDQVRLADGFPPEATVGTPVGDALNEVYKQLGRPHGEVTDEVIRKAMDALPANQYSALVRAAFSVPGTFSPNLRWQEGQLLTSVSGQNPSLNRDAINSQKEAINSHAGQTTPGSETQGSQARASLPPESPPGVSVVSTSSDETAPEPSGPVGSERQERTDKTAPSGSPGGTPDPASSGQTQPPDGPSYKLALETNPTAPVVGATTNLTFRISRIASRTASQTTPALGAVVIVRVRQHSDNPNASWTIARTAEKGNGAYSFRAVFHQPGAYEMTVTVIPIIDQPFTAGVALDVKAANSNTGDGATPGTRGDGISLQQTGQ